MRTRKKIAFTVKGGLKIFALVLFDSMMIFLTFILAVFLYLMSATPFGDSLYARDIPQTSVVYDRTGEQVLYEIHGEENRKIIPHEKIPDAIRMTTIAAEDDEFYTHDGIDLKSTARAIKKDIENGNASQGGSTITQQLARNVYLNREKSIKRKVLEAIYAFKIENKYSKDQILDAYLNQVPYGSNTYGVETASETYFGKSASDLTLDEAAMLSAVTKAPSYYSPYGNHQDRLMSRQKEILERVARLYPNTDEEVKKSLAIDTSQKVIPFVETIKAPHFVFYVIDHLEKKYGKEFLEKGGLKIYTTLDYPKQELAEKTIATDTNLRRYGASNAALVAIDPTNGQILAMAGSRDYYNDSIDGKVNVTIRPRQPGSSFKPFVYAKAFEKGYQPEDFVLDAKTNFGPDGSGRNYVPNNYDGRFHGIVSMRQALSMSLNIPAIKTLRAVGIDDAIEIAHRLGITTLNERQRYGLALVIGGGEVTLLDETAGYSVFANDGKRNPADPILKIINDRGKVIQENEPQNIPVLNPEVARKINSILSDTTARIPTFGPGNKLAIPGKIVAAKTGTTQEFRDAWTVGYTPHIAVGVWVGNNNNRPMRAGADGSFVAAPLWNTFMSQVLKNTPSVAFTPYSKTQTQKGNEQLAVEMNKKKITYYKLSNGKEISKERAKKMDPDEVGVKFKLAPRHDDDEEDKEDERLFFIKPVF